MDEGMTYSRGMWIALALGTLLVVGAGCAGSVTKNNLESPDDGGETVSGTMPVPLDGAMVDEMVVAEVAEDDDASGIREIKMIARSWEFEPSEIRAALGETVKITITNEDVDHGFAIPTLGINQFIGAGETVSVEFTASKAGEHTFFCNVFCGDGHGKMRGTLIVE